MSYIQIIGNHRLEGELQLQGSKNSVLPILAATVICKGDCVLHNCPMISDVFVALEILRSIGCSVKIENNTVIINAINATDFSISYDLMKQMRSSIIFLGAFLSRFNQAKMSFPGGCELGPRPIDIHICALKALGANVTEKYGFINCRLKDRVKCGNIHLSFPSVGATENIMLSSVIGDGIVTIKNAAREPEIIELAEFLNMCGAKIFGAGESEISIIGVKELHGCEKSIVSDRIAAVTYMSAVAAAKGTIVLNNVETNAVFPVLPAFVQSGCDVRIEENRIILNSNERLKSIEKVRTMPYPGFPTDAQPLLVSMMCKSCGTTMFIETIFQNRFKFVEELRKFGAVINVEGNVAVVKGVSELYGAQVECTDLRGGASVLIAALSAEGTSEIYNTSHIYRGYEDIENNLALLGADIKVFERM